jgi:hypothetical protein
VPLLKRGAVASAVIIGYNAKDVLALLGTTVNYKRSQ